MARQKIYKWCELCHGTGTVVSSTPNDPNPQTCPYCGGAKKIEWGYLKVEQEAEV